MYIVFDTNVWLSELALNSAAGAAVRLYVRQKEATVVLPEVVRLEVERNLTRRLAELAETIKANHRQLLAVFGKLKEVIVPGEGEISEKVRHIMDGLDVPTKHVAFSLEAARSSLLKTIDKVPPCDKTQEFKDGVIWAHCVDLLRESDVYLVTADKAFFEEREYRKGLAKNLLQEASAAAHQLILLPNLGELLRNIRSTVKPDESNLVNEVLRIRSDSVHSIVDRAGYRLGNEPRVDVRVYATESAAQLYLEFQMEFGCEDASGKGRAKGTLEIRGDGSYDTSSKEYVNLRSHGEKFTYTDEDGEQKMENYVLMVGNCVIGHRSVLHSIKYDLG